MIVQVPLSRSGKSGLSVVCTPVSDSGFHESAGSGGSRLTATNLTEFDNLQRQVSRKDKPRSPLHGRASPLSDDLTSLRPSSPSACLGLVSCMCHIGCLPWRHELSMRAYQREHYPVICARVRMLMWL